MRMRTLRNIEEEGEDEGREDRSRPLPPYQSTGGSESYEEVALRVESHEF